MFRQDRDWKDSMEKQRQVNQLTTPVDIAKAMYLKQREGLMDTILGQPQRVPTPQTNEINELVNQIMLQAEVEQWQ